MKKLFALATCILCLLVLSSSAKGNTPEIKKVKKTLKRELPIIYHPWLKPEVLEGVTMEEAEEIVADFGDELSDLQYLMTRGSFAHFVSLGTEEARTNYLNGSFWNPFRIRYEHPREKYLTRIEMAKKYFGGPDGDISGSDRARLLIVLGLPDGITIYNDLRPWNGKHLNASSACSLFGRLEFWGYNDLGLEIKDAPPGDAIFLFYGSNAKLWLLPNREILYSDTMPMASTGAGHVTCFELTEIQQLIAATEETLGSGRQNLDRYLGLPDPSSMEGELDKLPVMPLGQEANLPAEFTHKAEHVKDVFANGEWHYSGRARVVFRFSVPVGELVANSAGEYSVGAIFELYDDDRELIDKDISVVSSEVEDGACIARVVFTVWPGKYHATVKVYDAVAKMMHGEDRAHIRSIDFTVNERNDPEEE